MSGQLSGWLRGPEEESEIQCCEEYDECSCGPEIPLAEDESGDEVTGDGL